MGLDTSHDCWHGPYSAFGEWRNAIAQAAGWTERETTRYGSETYVLPPYTNEQLQDHLYGWWGFGKGPEDPIEVLLVHSDCDGYIFPWHTEALADRLEQLDLSKIDDEGRFGSGWVSEARDRFVAGLRKAAEEYQIVLFH